jgi:hypothetical protein
MEQSQPHRLEYQGDVYTPALKECYELWFEWAKRTEQSKWPMDDQVKKDFGNLELPFDEWWEKTGEELFQKTPVMYIKVFKDAATLNEYYDPDSENEIFVSIDMTLPKKRLLAKFRELLEDWHQTERGKPPEIEECAAYPLKGSLLENGKKAMKEALGLYDLRQKMKDCDLWEVGSVYYKGDQSISEKDPVKIAADKKKKLTKKVGKRLKTAECIIEHVAIGEFPVLRSDKK